MLLANATNTQITSSTVLIDFTSTGFSFPSGYAGTNRVDDEYIYWAFKTTT